MTRTEHAGDGGVEYDPFAPGVLAEPFGAYADLLDRCPLHRAETHLGPLWTAARHDDVVAISRDHARWTARFGQAPLPRAQGGMFDDPPGHTPFRRIVQAALGPRRVESLEPMIRALCDELLDEVEPETTWDLHDAVACPLPVIVIARTLGVAEDDLWTFKRWSDETLAAMNDPSRGVAEREALRDYLQRSVEERWAADDPPDDLTTALCTAEVDGRRLDMDELLSVLNQLLVGGNETTTSLITNVVWRLLEDRDRWERLLADRSLVPVAVEESLRFDPPVLGLYRQAVADTEVAGTPVPEGARVMMCYGAANRDPAHFTAPDRFDLDRDPAELRDHVAFGSGVHFCPGAPLSRLETRILLERLLDRCPDLHLADEAPERIETYLLWGRRRLVVRRGTPARPS